MLHGPELKPLTIPDSRKETYIDSNVMVSDDYERGYHGVFVHPGHLSGHHDGREQDEFDIDGCCGFVGCDAFSAEAKAPDSAVTDGGLDSAISFSSSLSLQSMGSSVMSRNSPVTPSSSQLPMVMVSEDDGAFPFEKTGPLEAEPMSRQSSVASEASMEMTRSFSQPVAPQIECDRRRTLVTRVCSLLKGPGPDAQQVSSADGPRMLGDTRASASTSSAPVPSILRRISDTPRRVMPLTFI